MPATELEHCEKLYNLAVGALQRAATERDALAAKLARLQEAAGAAHEWLLEDLGDATQSELPGLHKLIERLRSALEASRE